MRKFKRLTMTLAALLALTTGAWAQESNEIIPTPVTGETNQWTFTMPANNVELQVEYEPSYNVTFNTEGLDAEEAAKFTASPNTGVYKGETVTVTYTGTKRLIGVKAEKKAAAAEGHALSASEVGELVGTDGLAYAVADKDNLPTGVTAAGMVAYKNGSNGLVIALTDKGSMNWSTACGASGAAAHTPAITGQTWKLPSRDEWNQMFTASTNYSGLNTAITTAGGTALQEDNSYWSSSQFDDFLAWNVYLYGGDAEWGYGEKDYGNRVRACLAF